MAVNLEHRKKSSQISALGLNPDFSEAGGIFRLRNPSGTEVLVTPYGMGIVAVLTPDVKGDLRSVILGFNSLAEYRSDSANIGRLVGPDENKSRNWSNQEWDYEPGKSVDSQATFRLGGPIDATVTLALGEDNTIYQRLVGRADAAPRYNPRFFWLWNLDGTTQNIGTHRIVTNADHFLDPANQEVTSVTPTGPLDGCPLNLTEEVSLGERMYPDGIDHYLIFPGGARGTMTAYSQQTGIGLNVESDPEMPGAYLYTGGYLKGKPAERFGGFAWCPAKAPTSFLRPVTENVREVTYRLFHVPHMR